MLFLASSSEGPAFADTQILRPFKPIDFPDADRLERARKARQRIAECEDARRISARVAHEQAVVAARANGRDEGYMEGYTAGVNWGMFIGFTAGAIVATALGVAAVLGRAWWLAQ